MSETDLRPDLEKWLEHGHVELAESWGMDFAGVPVASDGDRNLVIWVGSFTDRNVAPVIVASIEKGRPIGPSTTLWFGGLASREVVTASPSDIEAYADAATFPATELGKVVSLVRDLMDNPSAA